WNYSKASFSEEAIKELSRVYVQFLLDENPEGTISEQNRELETLEMPGKALYPNQALLHEKVFAACDFFNNKIAIRENGQNISYSELKANSIQLANAIIRSGNAKKEVVGILDYPGTNATTGILAILASGNAYVPLDPDWPTGRIEDIITHSGIVTLLTSSIHLSKFSANERIINQLKTIILLDNKEATFPTSAKVNLLSFHQESNKKLYPLSKIGSPDSLAYIMYTSGTTGIPKGVMVSHRAIEVFLNWISEEFNINNNDKFIQTSSLGFGGSVRQIFSTLLAGGEIYPIDRFDYIDPISLLLFIAKNEISILNTVPSVLANISEYLEQLNPNESVTQLKKLRLLLIGGEILPAKLVERWKKHFGNFHDIINLYGSTETLVNATFHKIKNDFDYSEGIPVGKPRKGSHILLLNENGTHAKPGEKGELFVGGP
ncbi:MAG: AMP-binding protein, partial [Flavobacterium sp.]|nr:AMP-binding protein [Flavobacterium sp.]